MSWFQSTNIASFAKTALKEAQKTIDKALDISEEDEARNNGGSSRNPTAAVSNAVTDMASEFFASWGVGAAKDSNAVDATASDSSSGGASNQMSAISTPPKKSVSVIDELDSGRRSILTSDVPVTLLASTTSHDDNLGSYSNSHSQVFESDVSNSASKHTRSLSDTVFHAPDDSNNLCDLVQILDDNLVSLDHDSVKESTLITTNRIITHRGNTTCENAEENGAGNLIGFAELKNEDAAIRKASLEKQISQGNNAELQEISLEGGFAETESEECEISSKCVINEESSSGNVESSSLSDGWDWASASESCLVIGEREDIRQGDYDESERREEDKTEDNNSSNTDSTLKIEEEAAEASQTCYSSYENAEIVDDVQPTSIIQDSSASAPVPVSSSSSRQSSPVCQEPEHTEERESTPPSSARVSPNFEIVPSSGAPQPESSRSSSIVVVSGRESTPNSRGTSGAGSSGSSDGGHDIVDTELPHSPAATASSPTSDYCAKTKHRKGASSSSSDIEVIQSEFSSCLPSSNNMTTRSVCKFMDIAIQTKLVELKEIEIQTEKEESEKPALDPQELSNYVSMEVATILEEREAEVQQLREEGEKLSVKQFELGQVIKKLRGKEKETENVIKGLRTEVATKNLELEKLMKTFISKEGIEQSQNDTISKINQERRKLELKVEQLNSELEDARDNVDSMKATVENASIEILELKNVISSVQRESAEVDRLTREKAELISRTESLQKEVDHLRSVLNSSQSSHHSREAELKSQISHLTLKVHQLENSLADISSEVADATMPLSIEIEKLQSELKQQLMQADRREHAMQSTISDLELKLTATLEREKSARDSQILTQSQHSILELRINELEGTNASLTEQLLQKDEIYKRKLEDKITRYQKLEKTVERLTGEVERLSSENDSLSTELKSERSNLETERRRSQTLMDSRGDNNNLNHRQHNPHHQRTNSVSTASSTGGSSQTTTLRNSLIRNDNSPRSRDHSPSDNSVTSEEVSYLDEVFDPNTGMMVGGGSNNRSMTPKSFFESFSSSGLIENLQSQLRLREGEVIAFQEELTKNERIRKQLNEEIANLTMQNQQLGIEMEKMGEMQQKLSDLDKNYNAVLQMYGEKVEEADELRMDLDDVKEMYKTQIEQLLKKS